jgi:type VII secretion system (Wss) protein YukD
MADIDRTIATDIQETVGLNLLVDEDVTADNGEVSQPAESLSVDQAVGDTPDAEAGEAAEESPAVCPSRVEITFRHASGSARLLVPRDVPLGELLPEFLELAGVDERGDQWDLTSDDGGELRSDHTLAQCSAGDGSVLVLKHQEVAPRRLVPSISRASRDSRSQRSKPRQAKPARPKGPNSTGRALSERTARTLPAKVTAIERMREALKALRVDEWVAAATSPTGGTPSPDAFALPARPSLRVRMREAWALATISNGSSG